MNGIELKSGNLVFIGNDLFKGEDGDFQQVNGEPSLQMRLLCIDSSGNIIWERSLYTSKNNSTVVHDAFCFLKMISFYSEEFRNLWFMDLNKKPS